MTNKDKYLKDGVDIEELTNEIVMFEVKEIGWQIAEKEKDRIKRFFEQSLKPTLTEDEKVILRNLPKDVDSIDRDSDGELEIKMINQNNCNDFGYDWFGWYDKLFQFIKPRRRI